MVDSIGCYTDYFGGIDDIKEKKLKPIRIENILNHGIRLVRGARLAATRNLELCVDEKDIMKANFSEVNDENFIYELRKAEKAEVRDKFVKIIIEKGIYKNIDPKFTKIFQALGDG